MPTKRKTNVMAAAMKNRAKVERRGLKATETVPTIFFFRSGKVEFAAKISWFVFSLRSLVYIYLFSWKFDG